MRVARGRTYITSELTVDGDIDMLTQYQVKRLASPASGEALRKGSAEILNADIHASANIALSKLLNHNKTTHDALNIDADTLDGSHLADIVQGPTIVRKTADKTLNNEGTKENDDHLLLAIGANEVWQIDIFVLCQGNEDAYIQFGFSYPTDCLIKWSPIGAGYYVDEYTWGYQRISDHRYLKVQNGSLPIGISASNVTGYRLSLIVINGANAGNVNLQWAQGSPTVGDTKVLENSCLIAHQLA